MGGARYPHHMGRDFGIEMGRHRNVGGRRQAGRLLPAGDPADAHEIGHHQIAGLGFQRFVHVARPIKILADLQRRFERRRQLGVAGEVIIDHRLLDPGQT